MNRTIILVTAATVITLAAAAMPQRPRAAAAAIKPESITYAHDIAPIMNERCVTCHRSGEVAPFSLEAYDVVRRHAREIAGVTKSRLMPPWKADSHGEFEDERRLTAGQIDTIQKWVEGGMPEGNKADLPAPPKFKPGWKLGEPDAVLEASEDFHIPAEGPDIYRCFVIPAQYAENRYVAAMDVRPGTASVVHHVIAYLDTSGKARQLDAADPGPGYTSYGGIGVEASGALGGWAPGITPHMLPQGVGVELPKGADIVLQVHYHPTGKAETDRTRVGLYFAKGPVDKRARIGGVIAKDLRIPAGDAHYRISASRQLPFDITLLGVAPHMHMLGQKMDVAATLPDGTKSPLISVPDWDFNWQAIYFYRQPIVLPKGTTIDMQAQYDNSAENPRNPNTPPKEVGWGEQTTDEMSIAFFWYTVDAEHLTKGQLVPVETDM